MTGTPAAGGDSVGADVEEPGPDIVDPGPSRDAEDLPTPASRGGVGPVIDLDPEPRYLEAQDTGPIVLEPPPPAAVPVVVRAPGSPGPGPGDRREVGSEREKEPNPEAPSREETPDGSGATVLARGGIRGARRSRLAAPFDPPHVLTVVIARSGRTRTADVITAVAGQSRVPDDVVLIDATPAPAKRRDPSAPDPRSTQDPDPQMVDLLDRIPRWQILRLSSRLGLADVMRAAVMASDVWDLPGPAPDVAADGAATDRQQDVPGWIWVLPDDGSPASDALEQLLSAVETAPSVGIAGGKQVASDDDQRLWEVGFTTTRRGVRVTGIDRHEVDQGQHDYRCDVLAVTGAGMLIRRDVWDSTGGFDPGLAGARDDLDLCRRARLAGHRVIVVPNAVISRTGRPITPGGAIVPTAATAVRGPWARADRYDALYLRMVWTAWPLLPLVWSWILLSAFLRTLPLTLARQPRRAWHELVAAFVVCLHPHRWLRARMRGPHRRGGRRALRPLLATRRDLWRQRRDVLASRFGLSTAAVSRGVPRANAADPSASGSRIGDRRARREAQGTVIVTGDETGTADEPLQIRAAGPRLVSSSRRSVLLAPIPVLVVTAIAGITASWRLLGGTGTVAGPFLTPAPATTGELWGLVSGPLRSLGLGIRAVADPFDELLVMVSALPGASPPGVLLFLLVAALPLSALTAWAAAGQVVRARAVRIWAALAWAASPPLLIAVGSGRPAAVGAHIVLPLAALALVRSVGGLPGGRHGRVGTQRPRGSVAAATAAGLALTVVLASAPSLVVAAALAVSALALTCPGRRRYLLIPVAVVGILLAPWWAAVAREPRLLVADPGLGGPADAADSSWWHLLSVLGDPRSLFGGVGQDLAAFIGGGLTAGTAALVLSVLAGSGVLALGLIGLLRGGPGRLGAVLGWTVGLTGLGTALVAERIVVADTPAGTTVGFAGPGLSLFALGAVIAAVAGLWTGVDRSRHRGTTRADLAGATVTVLSLSGSVLVLAAWSWQGATTADIPMTTVDTSVGETFSGERSFTVELVDPDILPAVAAAEAAGPASTRTLVLRVSDSQVRWSLLRAAGPRLGENSAAAALGLLDLDLDKRDSALVVPAIGDLLSDSGRDVRSDLADLDIGAVLLLGPTDEASTLALDSSPGLERVLSSDESILWRVGLDGAGGGPTRPSFARILAPDGTSLTALSLVDHTVRARVPAGPSGRTLVLSTRVDTGWTATVDGSPLPSGSHAGWAQSFPLPADGGQVVLTYRDATAQRLMLLRMVALGLAVLMAFPWPRLRQRVVAPPRRSRPVPRVSEPGTVDGSAGGTHPRIFDEDYPDPDNPFEPVDEAPRVAQEAVGVVLEPLPSVPDADRDEPSTEAGGISGGHEPRVDIAPGTAALVPDDFSDAFSGSLSTGFVDWAAVRLPDATDPDTGSDPDSNRAGEPDTGPDSEDEVRIDLVEICPDPEAAPLGARPSPETEDGPADEDSSELGHGPEIRAGSAVREESVSRTEITLPETDTDVADPASAGSAKASGDMTGAASTGTVRTEDDDDDPVPPFPGADPDELADFEPYRPDAGRPLRSSRRDNP